MSNKGINNDKWEGNNKTKCNEKVREVIGDEKRGKRICCELNGEEY